jgi:hypothetical protein
MTEEKEKVLKDQDQEIRMLESDLWRIEQIIASHRNKYDEILNVRNKKIKEFEDLDKKKKETESEESLD